MLAAELVKLYQIENQAMVAKDTATLERLLAPEMHLIHMTGYDQPKKEWLAQIETEEMCYYSSEQENVTVDLLTEERAELTGQNLVSARIWGSKGTWRLQMKVYFEKRAGKWVIVKQVASTY